MAERSLVSVVIPTYNRAELLRRALESVASQDYRPIEVLVIDDCSEDDTEVVIDEVRPLLEESGGIGLRYTALEVNSGPAAARNEGLRQAAGSFVAFLDSDDLWHQSFVSSVVDVMHLYPECGVVFSGNDGVDGDGNVVPNRLYDFGYAGSARRLRHNRRVR
jgi:glycosyltransferase involved in cell wall biosynthesis